MNIMSQNSLAGTLKRSSQTYVLITAFLSLLAIVGFALYGLPFFYDFMMKEFGWTRTIVTSGNAYSKILVAPLFGFFAGWLIDRYGPRKMLMVGAILGGAALIGLALMSSLWMFYFFYVFNAIGYVFGGPLPCQVLISRWFEKNRGKAMGIAYLGIGTGGVIVPQLSAGLEKGFGWHYALCGIGILMIVIAFPLAFFLKDPGVSIESVSKEKPSVPFREMLKSRNFYLLAIGSMCSIAAVGGANQHLKLYLRELNYTQAGSANIISLVLFASLAGRVLMGWLADIFPRKYVMILIYLIVASAIPLLLLPDFPGRIYIFAVIFGVGLGGDYMIIPLMAGDLFGVRTLGRIMGIILVADGIAEATSPMMVSYLFDGTKSYTSGFIVLICIALAGAFFVFLLPKTWNKIENEKVEIVKS
jgi:MFS family permease